MWVPFPLPQNVSHPHCHAFWVCGLLAVHSCALSFDENGNGLSFWPVAGCLLLSSRALLMVCFPIIIQRSPMYKPRVLCRLCAFRYHTAQSYKPSGKCSLDFELGSTPFSLAVYYYPFQLIAVEEVYGLWVVLMGANNGCKNKACGSNKLFCNCMHCSNCM